jgi:short subunit dehydrogenase-like uncharacterized protein
MNAPEFVNESTFVKQSTETNEARWIIYGANGYTGELIAREAVQRGLKPILAGRNAAQINALAKELSCEARIFTIENQTATLIALQDVVAVLNCAGPFAHTAGRMMQACLASHVHYLDITGEIDVFELAQSLDDKAKRARSVLCPGVGFDVVPTDCVAACLRDALPDATHLALAFATSSRSSIGTAKTQVESMGLGGRIRKEGKITAVPFSYRAREIDFGEGVRQTACIPWGDVSTAFYTTAIPNIEVYIAGPEALAKQLQQADKWSWALRNRFVQWLLKKQVARGSRGPNQTERECNPTLVWGEVTNAAQERKVARIRVANGYVVTVHASLAILARLLGERELAGYFTPAKLMGSQFVETLPGSSQLRIEAT